MCGKRQCAALKDPRQRLPRPPRRLLRAGGLHPTAARAPERTFPFFTTEEPAASPRGLWRPIVPRLIVWHGASRVKEHGEETQESEYVAFGGAPGVAFGGAPSVAQPSSSPAVGPGKGLGKAAPFPRPPRLHIRSGCQPLAATLPVRSLTVTPLPLGRAADSPSCCRLSSEVLFFILSVISESLLNPFQVSFFLSPPFRFRNMKLDTEP